MEATAPMNAGECPPPLKNVLSSFEDQDKLSSEALEWVKEWSLYWLWWQNQTFMKFGLFKLKLTFKVKVNHLTKQNGS